MLQVFVDIPQKVLLQRRGMGYAKVIHKKELKNGQVFEISKTMGT
jgi:hypothetical protein